MKTYMWEMLFAFVYVFFFATITTDFSDTREHIISFLTSFGVLFAFARTTVADRMAEAQARATERTVSCYRWFTGYLYAGEVCWALVFLISGNFVAMSSIPLFLLYPVWRKWYRSQRRW